MTKTAIDYSKACVYRLIYNNITYYVGSTTNMRMRKSQHKTGCYNEKHKDYNYPLYKFIRENGGFNNWIMVMIQAYPECKTGDELKMNERDHIENYETLLNLNRPIVSKEEKLMESRERSRICRIEKPEIIDKWRKENVEHIKEYRKQYRIENADKIKEYNESHKEEQSLKGKKYREENAGKIKEQDSKRGLCECGCEINLRHKNTHIRSKRHIDTMTAINNDL
jgi:GIY-YIG catalytic domain